MWLIFKFISGTVRYKILEGENYGEFGKVKAIRQNFLSKIFLNTGGL